MVEKATYWICRCGQANDNGFKSCQSCGQKRRLKLLFPTALLVTATLAVLFTREHQKVPAESFPENEIAFQKYVENWREKIPKSPNEVAASESLSARNQEIYKQFGSIGDIEDWQGRIEGISKMNDGAGLAVSAGGVQFVAGVHLGLNLNTLISQQDDLYPVLLKLKVGDTVLFSGKIQDDGQKSAVALNYSLQGSIANPDLLFQFTSIKILP